jgi:hypothetical protein
VRISTIIMHATMTLGKANVAFLGGKVFTVDESSADYHVTLAEHFAINVRNETVFTFRVTKDLVTFDIRVCSSGIETLKNGRICLSIQVATSQQEIVRLFAVFGVKSRHDSWIELNETFSTLSVNNAQTYNFMLRNNNNVANKTNKVLVDSDILTIGINGSCVIRSQHTIATSTVRFNPELHTSVNASYTWTVCNVTLPNPHVSERVLESKTLFTNLGVAEFYLRLNLLLASENNNGAIAIFVFLANAPVNIKLPFRAQHTFVLVDSNSPQHAVIVQKRSSNQYKDITAMGGSKNVFEYADFVKSMKQHCVTIKYYVAYDAAP